MAHGPPRFGGGQDGSQVAVEPKNVYVSFDVYASFDHYRSCIRQCISAAALPAQADAPPALNAARSVLH